MPLPAPAPLLSASAAHRHHGAAAAVAFRSLAQIAADPDRAPSLRLDLMVELGLGWAGAVPIPSAGDGGDPPRPPVQGVLVLVARRSASPRALAQRPEHLEHWRASARLLGAALDAAGPRRRARAARQAHAREAWRRARRGILRDLRDGVPLGPAGRKDEEEEGGGPSRSDQVPPSEGGGEDDDSRAAPWCSGLREGLRRWARSRWLAVRTAAVKSRGAGAPVPPAFDWGQTRLTFAGCLSTLLAVTLLSDFLVRSWGPEYGMVLGYELRAA
jgi:hypothetical protein